MQSYGGAEQTTLATIWHSESVMSTGPFGVTIFNLSSHFLRSSQLGTYIHKVIHANMVDIIQHIPNFTTFLYK